MTVQRPTKTLRAQPNDGSERTALDTLAAHNFGFGGVNIALVSVEHRKYAVPAKTNIATGTTGYRHRPRANTQLGSLDDSRRLAAVT